MRFLKHIAFLLLGLATAQSISAAVVDIGKVKYSLNDATGEATAIGIATNLSDWDGLEIPDFVTHNDIDYPVTEIASDAFHRAVNELQFFTGTLVIGNNVKTIGDSAFENCYGFTGSLTIGDNVTTIGNDAFAYCGFNGTLTIGENVQSIGNNAFLSCYGFTGSLTIGENVQSIGNYAFHGCYGFTGSLTIGDKVQTIGDNAFASCRGFTGSLTIGDSVQMIGVGAFAICSGFTGSLTIGDNVQTIGDNAFAGCSGFTGSLTIGDNVQRIGNSAFWECSGLSNTLSIGKSMTYIDTAAFYGINDFKDIIMMPSSIVRLGNCCTDVFTPTVISYRAVLRVPANLVKDYRNSEAWSDFSKIYSMEEPTAVNFAEAKVEIEVGQIKKLGMITEPQYAWADLTYTSSDPSVATVTDDGHVTGIAPGTTIITATGGELTATCEVMVSPSAQLIELEEGCVSISVSDSGVDIINVPMMARVIVSALDGRVVTAMYAEKSELHIPLEHGVYIVKVGDTTTAKILI